jgi:hypothetical protein
MASGDGLTAVYHLNRLAGTILNGVPQYDFNGAAQIWALNVTGKKYTRGIDALNQIYAFRNSGKNYYYDTPGAFNALAGTFGLGENEAAARIVS